MKRQDRIDENKLEIRKLKIALILILLLFFASLIFFETGQQGFNKNVIDTFDLFAKHDELVVESIKPLVDGHWECIEWEDLPYDYFSQCNNSKTDEEAYLIEYNFSEGNTTFQFYSKSGEPLKFQESTTIAVSGYPVEITCADGSMAERVSINKSVCTKRMWVKG